MGRLQHDGYWPHSRGNQLKRQLTFAATPDDSLPDAAERADLANARLKLTLNAIPVTRAGRHSPQRSHPFSL